MSRASKSSLFINLEIPPLNSDGIRFLSSQNKKGAKGLSKNVQEDPDAVFVNHKINIFTFNFY